MQPASQEASLLAAGQHLAQRRAHLGQACSRFLAMYGVELLLRKIELRLGQRAQIDQLSLQGSERSGELPGQGAQRAAGCFSARSVDEISHRLGLREIEAALEKGAPGEFTGFGEARAAIEACRE